MDPGRVAGRVKFDGVVFGYEKGSPVLRGLNLEVKPGELTVITGDSGSGKTSRWRTCCCAFTMSMTAAISIDGADIRDLTLSSLRRNVGVVYQDAYVFNATIRENIAYGVAGRQRRGGGMGGVGCAAA